METIKTAVVGGRKVRMTGDPADPYFGAVESVAVGTAPLAAWARANLPAEAVMLDVGGNIGVTALLLATLRPRGHVHVFEAMPANVAHLRRNRALNGVGNCTVVAAAVGAAPGRIALAGAGAAARVVSVGVPPAGDGGVPVVTLDGYVREHARGRVDFVKMDIEGYEPAALEGAAEVMERDRPPVLMEFNTWCLAYAHEFNPIAFAKALWDAFDAYRLAPNGSARRAGGGDVVAFLHDNMVHHGAVDDLLLRLRPGERVPRRAATGWAHKEPDRDRLRQLEAELEAMRRSTSWRVTAPLRALRRRLVPRAGR